MANRAVNQFKSRLNGALADLLNLFRVADTLNMSVCAKFKVNFIRVVNRFLRQILADKLGQIAAHLIGKRKLAVRKRTGSGKSCCDMAIGLAIHAFACYCLGAFSFFNGFALFNYYNAFFAAFFNHFDCGKNTGRACAHYCNIIFFHNFTI